MKAFYLAVLLSLPILLSCSNSEEDSSRKTLTGDANFDSNDSVVQAADGSLYSVGCLQSNSAIIQQRGASSLATCKVNLSADATQEEVVTRGKFFTNNYAYVFYPPTYYSPYYGTPSYTTSSVNYGSLSSPYTSYNTGSSCWWNDNQYSNDSFCKWIFGSNSNMNCYYLFGYNNNSSSYSNYSNYYNVSCNNCFSSSFRSACLSRCYNTMYIY